MMNQLTLTFLFLLAGINVWAQEFPGESDLYLHLAFNHSYEDASIHGHTPDVFNNPSFVPDRNDVENNSLLFTGAEYLSFENVNGTPLNSSITIAAWIKTSKSSSNQKILCKDDYVNRDFSFHTINGSGQIMFAKWKEDVLYEVQDVSNVCDGEYHFVTCTDDGSYIKVYVDGVLENSGPSAMGLDNDPVSMIIGRRGDGNLRYEGNMDQVLVFTQAISASEISQLMSNSYDIEVNPIWKVTNENNIYYENGSVTIGDPVFPSGYALAVDGKLITEEVKVEKAENWEWPDYVFKDGYDIPTLNEVHQHIIDKGHLPEIPSEREVNNNGINLGEMNAKLLKKIEELTLYLIEQNQKLEEQMQLIRLQQEQINQLEMEMLEIKKNNEIYKYML